MMNDGEKYQQVMCDFIESLGIAIIPKRLDHPTFLPGLDLGPNCIYLDVKKMQYPGDLLHEAGHLAVTTAAQRAAVGSDALELPWPTDGEEIAAVLWSYAAALHLGVPLEVVFHDNGYKNDSAWLIDNFNRGQYIGLPLLQWMGLCVDEQQAALHKIRAFPHMQKWLRD
ncbi:hypothetical protein [Undibacterium macrobrachii]|uniref:IrrE N-terminal-like domain-containing protein n=1 Tax=Undibacterium macrobrachii TaxID=1119058 RepID=A0ABQ2XM83_9BURK|nr:hypothetical protein [Undibacterium macrobrachii]GGX24326.1 hypothetical protein GCM10011282_32840 [Undibacterium macrobrachii]